MSHAKISAEEVRHRIEELSPWFHNIQIRGIWTAPDHFLGDYPAVKWRRFSAAIPADLAGKSVLDIGCNAGFHSMEMRRRGASRVVGIDFDDRYLDQARFAAQANGLDIEFRKLSVYDLALLGEKFDIVLFMGVLYHLRHPLLALDLIHEHVAKDILIFQSMQRGSDEVATVQPDYDFNDDEHFDDPRYPKLHFVEKHYAHDPTNWWIPNRSCTEAMLRSAGFAIELHPEAEVYVCHRIRRNGQAGAEYPARRTDQ